MKTTPIIVVNGLWHLGCVTAACVSRHFTVIGIDEDASVIAELNEGRAPVFEPGLDDLIKAGLRSGSLIFTTDAQSAAAQADVMWVTIDTPVDDQDQADAGFVRRRIDESANALRPGSLLLISSQVPVGFTHEVERDWAGRGLHFAVSPENLRLGKAIEVFERPDRVIVGLRDDSSQGILEQLFLPYCSNINWMSIESAEMTKHAINAFLATSVVFINEVARICESVGANAKDVERGLKSEMRIGPKAYLGPGAAMAGGTLARDLNYLIDSAVSHELQTPMLRGVVESNQQHKNWLLRQLEAILEGVMNPTVAVLGLTYKPGTNTLRRSSSVEICRQLSSKGVHVRAYDPEIRELPSELRPMIHLATNPTDCLRDADVAVVGTEWPAFKSLRADDFISAMRAAQVIDQSWFMANILANDPRISYWATGKRSQPRPQSDA